MSFKEGAIQGLLNGLSVVSPLAATGANLLMGKLASDKADDKLKRAKKRAFQSGQDSNALPPLPEIERSRILGSGA